MTDNQAALPMVTLRQLRLVGYANQHGIERRGCRATSDGSIRLAFAEIDIDTRIDSTALVYCESTLSAVRAALGY